MRSVPASTLVTLAVTMTFLALTSCSGGNSGGSMNPGIPAAPGTQTMSSSASSSAESAMSSSVDTDTLAGDVFTDDSVSILKQLTSERTIGSTIVDGQLNPYGLDIAKTTAGKVTKGDLVICNFNNPQNIQGTGTTLLRLHPVEGSRPLQIANSPILTGCNALATAPSGPIWNAAFSSNANPIFSPAGQLLAELHGLPYDHPFGQAFSPKAGPFGVAAFYASNARGDGAIIRANILADKKFTFDRIATGFPINNGVPGSILGPSGLQYDARDDRLYIVDGTNNAVYALCHVTTIPRNGIHVNANGTTFSGPFAHRARLIFMGSPLNGPISSALLFNGHLVIGNTLDAAGLNLMVEITPAGHVLDVKNVDNGAGGAIFGMVASGTDVASTRLYFNDDNSNTNIVLKP